jgi:hypothetical protein
MIVKVREMVNTNQLPYLECPCKRPHGHKSDWYRSINPKHWNGYSKMHRWVAAKHYGVDLTSKDIVRHLCDNKWCVEPTHLAIGTQKDNVNDMYTRGRQPNRKGQGAILTDEDVTYIRNMEGIVSQSYLAHKFGVDPSTINHIIHGRKRNG